MAFALGAAVCWAAYILLTQRVGDEVSGLAGLAILLPVVPFAFELLALRRLTTAAFGTLMSLEPAIAMVIGFVILDQALGLVAVAGIGCVVLAGVGAERSGARTPKARVEETPSGLVAS